MEPTCKGVTRFLGCDEPWKPVIVFIIFLSLTINWIWVNLPLSELGLSGRQAIIFGKITLLQTLLYPHPYVIPWAAGFSLQFFCPVLLLLNRRRMFESMTLTFSGLSTLAFWLLVMERWNYSPKLVPMYALGLPASLVPLSLGIIQLLYIMNKIQCDA